MGRELRRLHGSSLPLRIPRFVGGWRGYCWYCKFRDFSQEHRPWRRKHRMVEYGDLEKDSDFLSSISPVNNAERIRAPLFVIHGTNDPRVPFEEAEQIVNKLRSLGRTVHLMKFEDEGHGLVKTKNKILGYSSAIKFLVESLKEDKQLPG